MSPYVNQAAVLVGHLSMPIGYEEYAGTYSITPKAEAQTIQTANKHLSNNIIIEPIPNNYGMITYDGGVLTVS